MRMLKWILILPLDILTTLLAYLIAPILALFADGEGDVTLHKYNPLRLWLTHDNPIEGDEAHYERWADWTSKHGLFVQRVAWLWRNKAYGWSYYVWSVKVKPEDQMKVGGNPDVNYGDPHGKFWAVHKKGWMLYATGNSLFGRYWRIYIGWKIRSPAKKRLRGEVQTEDYVGQYVCAFTPFKHYK